MREAQPAISDWKQLYEAAVEFKKMACWEWMMDSDIFGIQDPVSGEIGYCCIMGYLGEFMALAVYLGAEGLDAYMRIRNGEIEAGDMRAHTIQKCLMASFEDREFLTDEDRAIIKKLGLSFRGRNQWPLFRVYEPGFPPWHLNKAQAKYLTLALQQAMEVASRFKEDPDILDSPKKNHYLVKVPTKTGNKLNWEDKWLKPAPLEKPEIVIPPIDEIRLQKIKRSVKKRTGTWEADFFFTPAPIKEKKDERPYFPQAILYVDSIADFVLGVDITKPGDYLTQLPNGLMNIIENVGFIPDEIQVMKEEAFELLKLIADRLNIRLKLVKNLKVMNNVRDSMFHFLFR